MLPTRVEVQVRTENLAIAVAVSIQYSAQPTPSIPARRIANVYEDGEDGKSGAEADDDRGEDDEDDEEEGEDEDDEEDEEVADEYSDDEHDEYEEVLDDFGGFDTYSKYIENIRRRHENEDDARFRADLARAMAASKETAPPTTSIISLAPDSASNQAIGSASARPYTVATQTRSAVLDALERPTSIPDRLGRLKRLRGDSEDLHGTNTPPQKRPTLSRTTNCARVSQEVSVNPEGAEVFWDGELRQTATMHVDPRRSREDDKLVPVFRLSQIIGDKSQIEFAIISTYALQLSWIHTFFDPSTPVVLVTQPAPSENGNATIKQVLPNWIRVTPFLRGGRGVMHMKFLLLFYKSGRLRIVISTANLMKHDWCDIENTVWVQDVPRRPSPIAHEPKADDFASVFERVLCALNVAPAITNLVLTDHPNIPLTALCAGALRTRWDFSRVRPALVPSLAGRHKGWPAVIRSGHLALKRAVNRLNKEQRAVSLEYQGSSIGTYSAGWLAEFVLSARGISPEAALNTPRSQRAAMPMPAPSILKILFPTREWVQDSVLGEAGGGTMFCRKSTWEAAKFPRNLFCESRSRRGRVLMHSKMMIAVFVGASSSANEDSISETDSDIVEVKMDQDDAVGYAYIGSHNFTPSAWGTLSGSGTTPVLDVTNYELGIVFPLKDETEIDRVVCYERPPKQYDSKDRPWTQEVPNRE